jgi:hypothetical protein
MDETKHDSGEGPLSSEQLKRDEWRDEDGTPNAPGHTLPESERGVDDDDIAGNRPNPIGGTMLPPD